MFLKNSNVSRWKDTIHLELEKFEGSKNLKYGLKKQILKVEHTLWKCFSGLKIPQTETKSNFLKRQKFPKTLKISKILPKKAKIVDFYHKFRKNSKNFSRKCWKFLIFLQFCSKNSPNSNLTQKFPKAN